MTKERTQIVLEKMASAGGLFIKEESAWITGYGERGYHVRRSENGWQCRAWSADDQGVARVAEWLPATLGWIRQEIEVIVSPMSSYFYELLTGTNGFPVLSYDKEGAY